MGANRVHARRRFVRVFLGLLTLWTMVVLRVCWDTGFEFDCPVLPKWASLAFATVSLPYSGGLQEPRFF